MATNDRALIQIKGGKELQAALGRKQVALSHMGNAFHKSVILIDRWIQKNFQTEGQLAYPGKGWQPLSDATIAMKEKRWGKKMDEQKVSVKKGVVISKRLRAKIVSGKISKNSTWLKRQGVTIKQGGYDEGGRITQRLARRIAANKILQDRGQLRSRWKHHWTDKYAQIQSGVDYGIYHDSGEPRKHLPERKIIPTEKQIMPELLKIFGKHIETSLDK